MKKICFNLLLLASLSVGFRYEQSGPEEVSIRLARGRVLTGEILALRDSAIIFASPAGLTEEELASSGDGTVMIFPHRSVVDVWKEGSSYVFPGMVAGCGIGCLAGTVVGYDVNPDNASSGAALGSLLGALTFGGCGAALSQPERTLVSETQRDFTVLRSVARHPAMEPEYLKRIP